jgi:hypothetical protein
VKSGWVPYDEENEEDIDEESTCADISFVFFSFHNENLEGWTEHCIGSGGTALPHIFRISRPASRGTFLFWHA